MTQLQRQAVVNEALRWRGTPFRHQAMVLGSGVGCGTLLIAVYGACGYRVPSVSDCGHFPYDWHLHTSEEKYFEFLLRFTNTLDITGYPQPGDIALFRMGKVYAHSAIVIKWPQVLHVMWKGVCELANADQHPLRGRAPIFLTPTPF